MPTLDSVHEFSEYSICQKCNWTHLPPSPPLMKYDEKHNVLIRTCVNCGYKWKEKPADEAPPQSQDTQGQSPPETFWNKIEPKKP